MGIFFDGVSDHGRVFEPGSDLELILPTCFCWWFPTVSSQPNIHGKVVQMEYSTPRGTPFTGYGMKSTNGGDVTGLQVESNDGGIEELTLLSSAPSLDWHHYGMGRDFGNLYGWIDDTKSTDTTPNGNAVYSAVNVPDFMVGAHSGGNNEEAQGNISEVTIWSTLLSDAHISALSRGVNPFVMRNDVLVAHYPLYTQAATVPDYRSRYPMTMTGTSDAGTHGPVELLENYI